MQKNPNSLEDRLKFHPRRSLALMICAIAGTLVVLGATGMDRLEHRDSGDRERLGLEMWYKATAGNARFHTYALPQRLNGGAITWGLFLNGRERSSRFTKWGLINDPDCCTPGESGCPAKTLEETYGMDWCPGDEDLLRHVGKPGYIDPACEIKDPEGRNDLESPCELAYGTSTGAIGFRKFPNPRFDEKRWRELNGGIIGSWKAIETFPKDASIEPPFRIGVACASCHVGFNPSYPPADPNHPEYYNLSPTAGNPLIKNAWILSSGADPHALAKQTFTQERPGTTDTSGVSNDFRFNPGTMNAVINFPMRPKSVERVIAWRRVPACPDPMEDGCWCDPAFPEKCWLRSEAEERISHFLKGGEDSIVEQATVQRVYVNIGGCAEECFLNHLTATKLSLYSDDRNHGQTPFDIAQCRRECASFRAIEDRARYIVDFLMTARPTDLHDALKIPREELIGRIEFKYGSGSVERGGRVFARQCAECHSSQDSPTEARDFWRTDPDTGMRVDWLGNDRLTPASQVGTQACRALHSNHLPGNLWEQFSSETYKEKPGDPGLSPYSRGGNGYYRNVSLLNAWAFAPFMHNNAIGPEICAPTGGLPGHPASCWTYSPSVESRVRLFEASMRELLNPALRKPKVTRTDDYVEIGLLPMLTFRRSRPIDRLKLQIPAGTDVGALGSFKIVEMAQDLLAYVQDPDSFEDLARQKFGDESGKLLTRAFRRTVFKALSSDDGILEADPERLRFYMRLYASCPTGAENLGHRFGEHLTMEDKNALTAFLLTL